MSPFWNHILGLIYVEIAKIVETWKLAKKNCMQVGISTGDQYNITLAIVAVRHPPPHLLHSTTPPPPFRHPTSSIPPPHLLHHWPFYLYTKQVSDTCEFIIFLNYMNSYIYLGALAAPHTSLQIWIHRWHLAHQRSMSLLPWPIRVRSAAPTS